jgi:hypothetical protein
MARGVSGAMAREIRERWHVSRMTYPQLHGTGAIARDCIPENIRDAIICARMALRLIHSHS